MSAWALLGVAGVAGLFFSLYRNDVLLGVARRGGWEPRYLAFEARMLGTPGWGTPRSLTTELGPATLEPAAAVAVAAVPAPAAEPAPRVRVAQPVAPPAQNDVAASAPPAAAAAPPVTSPASTTSDGVKIVSLDALATLPAAPPSAPARAAIVAPAPPVAKAAVAKAPVAKAPVAKAPLPAPARPPAPVAAAPPVNENPLKAAIRTAIVKESQAK